jgi:hypothetical protein
MYGFAAYIKQREKNPSEVSSLTPRDTLLQSNFYCNIFHKFDDINKDLAHPSQYAEGYLPKKRRKALTFKCGRQTIFAHKA